MANVLLPTVGLKLQSENENFGSQNRTKANNVYTGVNTDLPFMNKPAEQMKYANAFAELTNAFAQRIIDRKKEALYNQAQNEMITKLSERENQYKALKGQDAIDGFAKYQEDIAKIKADYDQIFDSHPAESHKFKIDSNKFVTRYEMEGQNYYDSEVIKQADTELTNLFSNSMSEWFKHFNSPQENLFKQKAFDVLDQISDKNGIVKGSEVYNQQVAKMIDTYARSTVEYQLDTKNFSGALSTLAKCKDSMNGDVYMKLLGSIQSKQKAEAERQSYLKSLRSANRTYAPLEGAEAVAYLDKDAKEILKANPNMSEVQARAIAQSHLVKINLDRRALSDTNLMLGSSVQGMYISLKQKGIEIDPTDPFTVLPQEMQQILLQANSYNDKQAREHAKNLYNALETIANNPNTGRGDEMKLRLNGDPYGVIAEFKDPTGFDEWLKTNPQSSEMTNLLMSKFNDAYIKYQRGELKAKPKFFKEILDQKLTENGLALKSEKDNNEQSIQRSLVVSTLEKAYLLAEQDRLKAPSKYQDPLTYRIAVEQHYFELSSKKDFKEYGKKYSDKINSMVDSVYNTYTDSGNIVNDEDKAKGVIRNFILKDLQNNQNNFNTASYYYNGVLPKLDSLVADDPNEKEPVFTKEEQLRKKAFDDVSKFKDKDDLNDYESAYLKLANKFLKGEITKEEYEKERNKISKKDNNTKLYQNSTLRMY